MECHLLILDDLDICQQVARTTALNSALVLLKKAIEQHRFIFFHCLVLLGLDFTPLHSKRLSEKVHCLGVVVEDTFLFELDDSLANQFVDTGQRSRTQLSFALNRLGLVVISRVSIEFAWTDFVNYYVLVLALRVISNISLRIFLKLPQQLRLALELPVQLLLRLWTLEHQILEFVLDNRKAKIHEGFLRFQLFLLRLLPGCLFVHIGLEIKVSLT